MIVDLGPSPPIPFESSWMLMIKACAFNLIEPTTLFEILAVKPLNRVQPVRYWASDWIDMPTFSKATHLPTWVLHRSFVDQICPIVQIGNHHVRHCAECVKYGYHSVLFQFEVLTHCPWHGCSLTLCKACSRAFQFGGLTITPVQMISRDGCIYEVSLSCGHFHFLSSGSLFVQDIKSLPLDTIVTRSMEVIAWLRKCSSLGASGRVVTSLFFAPSSFSQQEQLFDVCLHHVETLIGCCPWQPKRRETESELVRAEFRLSCLDCATPDKVTEDADYIALFKSIRRHLFNKYVRRHKKCWNELSHFEPIKLHALDVTNACSVSSAFLVWLMALQWDAATGFSQYERVNLIQFHRNRCPVDLASVGLLWLLHFYALWGGIERECEKCRGFQDRFSVEICSSAPPLTLGEECVLCYGENTVLSGLCTTPHVLAYKCAKRCLSRLKPSAFINEQATWTIYHWAYDSKRHVLLRFWRGTHSKRGGQPALVVAG